MAMTTRKLRAVAVSAAGAVVAVGASAPAQADELDPGFELAGSVAAEPSAVPAADPVQPVAPVTHWAPRITAQPGALPVAVATPPQLPLAGFEDVCRSLGLGALCGGQTVTPDPVPV